MDISKLIDELVRDECIGGKPALKPYRDSVRSEKYPNGILTIGIGRNLEDCGLTPAEAFYLCKNDIEAVMADLDHALPWWRNLDEVRQRVLINMCFNMGISRLLGFKNMLAALQSGKYLAAAAEMEHSAWYGQVGDRAKRLAKAVMTGVMPLLIVAMLSCTHQAKKDEHFDSTEKVESTKDTQKEVAKTTEQAPSTLDIKTAHEDDAVVVQEADGTVQIAKVTARNPLVLKKGAKVIGTVPLSKTTVEQDRHEGAKTTTENESAKTTVKVDADKNVKLDGHEETATDVGFGWKAYAFGLLALVIILAAGYVYLKFIKKVVWL